jgi:hypothetical protein
LIKDLVGERISFLKIKIWFIHNDLFRFLWSFIRYVPRALRFASFCCPLHLTPYVFIGDEVIQPGHQRPSIDGTIGILVRSIHRNQMESGEVLRTLRSIPSRSTLYLKPSLLDEVIPEIKKEYNL